MNNRSIRYALLLAVAAAFVAFLPLFAAAADDLVLTTDDASAVTSASVETAAAIATPFIVQFAQQYPILATVLAVIAALRLVFKPVMLIAESVAKSTTTERDNEFIASVQHSRAYKVVAWLIDYLGSIKVGPQKQTAPVSKL